MAFIINFDNDSKHCNLKGDHYLCIKKYKKSKTFNQTRCDLYVNSITNEYPVMNHHDKCKEFAESKLYVKEKNKQLHMNFYANSKILLLKLLMNMSVTFYSLPNKLKVTVTNARWLRYDGNIQWLLAEDDEFFYEIEWQGS